MFNPYGNPFAAAPHPFMAPLPSPHATVGGGFGFGTGYHDIIGAAMDELDALDHAAGAGGGFGGFMYPAVGLKELVGMGEPGADEFMRMMAAAGAAPAGGGGGLAELAKRMQMARAIDPQAVVVRERAEDVRREFHMGFDTGANTAAGASGSATQQPQVTFRPERLVVPSFIAPFFTIDNIIVGKDSQTAVGANAVPATMYSEVAVGVRLNLKTANLGHLVTLAFTNVDTDPHRFRAAIIGTVTDIG